MNDAVGAGDVGLHHVGVVHLLVAKIQLREVGGGREELRVAPLRELEGLARAGEVALGGEHRAAHIRGERAVGLLLLPLLFFVGKGTKARVQVLLIPLLVVGLQFLPYLGGSLPIESLGTFAKHWTFNGVVHETLFLYFADNQRTRIVGGILLAAVVLLLSLSKRDLTDKIYLSVLFLLLFSPVVHPWYVTWLAVLLPIARRWSGIALTSTVSLTSLTVMQYKLSGVWMQHPLVLVVEYLPVIVLLYLESRKPVPTAAPG